MEGTVIRLESIVVGTDFTECSRVALLHARRIAQWSGAALHVVHVIEPAGSRAPGWAAVAVAPSGPQSDAAEAAFARWAAFRGGVPDSAGLEFEAIVAPRLDGLRRFVTTQAADLVVLGAFGERRPNVGLGTMASDAIRGLSTDVLVVRDDYEIPFRTVVAGIDFSDTSRRALATAAMLARGDGARLHAVHVVKAADGSTETGQRLGSEFGPALDALVDEVIPQGGGLEPVTCVFPYSGTRSGLLEFCACVDADVVVIGTRGHSNLRDTVLGSTAEKVLKDSACAVWACRARD